MELQSKRFNKLEKELTKYNNPNTPSSANKHLKPNTKGLKYKYGKRGAPKGHKGTTRKQISTRKEIIDSHICPNCNGSNVKDKQILKRVIEDVSEKVKPETVEAEIHKKLCKDCGHVFIPEHNTTPLKGKFGINIMIIVVFIKFILHGVLRKSSTFLDNGFALKMTPATINSIIKRIADVADSEYDALKYRIQTAHKIYMDETSFSVLGKNQWV
ncbi:MAG: transposase [Nanohaloarchaea archaeon]|nr:transposase [Candidatus Nanohaloarchaea archaeon]